MTRDMEHAGWGEAGKSCAEPHERPEHRTAEPGGGLVGSLSRRDRAQRSGGTRATAHRSAN